MSDANLVIQPPTKTNPAPAQSNVPAQPRPVTPQVAGIAAGVQAANIKNAPPPPAGLVSKSTGDIVSPWMRAIIYGETNARKTTTAAAFGTPENTRIIANLGEDQLIPLKKKNYQYVMCDTFTKLNYAMLYPEKLWPDWALRDDRVLIIDDLTKAKEMAIDDNEFSDSGNKQNNMIVHREAKGDVASWMKSLFARPLHLIGISTASIYENDLTHEENVTPDLPPGIRKLVTRDFSFCLYVDKAKWMFVTNDLRQTYMGVDEKMKAKSFTRVITAKRKLPVELEGKGIVNDLEPMDLRALWNKVLGAK